MNCTFICFASPLQTDATMTELEIDMNMRIGEWSIIQESGKELTPCYGPGYTGLSNLGNRYDIVWSEVTEMTSLRCAICWPQCALT